MKNYITWSKDEKNLFNSSSGGIFLELAKEMLKRKGIVVGVVMPDLEQPYYIFTKNLYTIKAMRGSKYLRAHLSQGVLDYMENFKGEILFTGLPCMIRKMKQTFKDKDNIIYIELKCHGVIKQGIYDRYMKINHPDAQTVIFRNKNKGWRNSTKLCVNGECFKSKLIKDYIQGKNLRGQCIHCKQQGYGDILLGDYWNCPSHLENKKGTSQVITISNKGQRFFNSLDNIVRKENSLNKVAIMGGASMNNNGSMILTQNFVDYLSKEIKDIGFTVVGYEEAPWEARKDILIGYIKSLFRPGQDYTKLEKYIRDCHTVVYLGGDHFIGKMKRQHKLKWLIHFFFTCINFYNLKRSGRKVYLVSQTMGQFPFYIKPFIRKFFGNLDKIYCRDTFSLKELKKLGLKNISLCSDLAFLPLQNEGNCDKGKIPCKPYSVLVISDLWRDYCKTPQDFIEKIQATIESMQNITRLPVYIVVHSSKKTPVGEEFVLKGLKKHCRNTPIYGVYFLKNGTPVVQRKILGNSKLNVSLRMHASLSSLEQGVPVVPIAYSIKYKAIYSDLDLSNLVAENFSEVYDKIEFVWAFQKIAKEKIHKALKGTKKMALKPILEIAKEIK